LFKKCTMVCSTNFYRNHSKFIISSPNILFCSFLPFLKIFSNLIDLYGPSIFGLSQLFFCLFLLNYWCVISWGGGRCGVTKFMHGCWSLLHWDLIDFEFRIPNASGKRCGITKFTRGFWSQLHWDSIDFEF
jgi:hypothetical protein